MLSTFWAGPSLTHLGQFHSSNFFFSWWPRPPRPDARRRRTSPSQPTRALPPCFFNLDLRRHLQQRDEPDLQQSARMHPTLSVAFAESLGASCGSPRACLVAQKISMHLSANLATSATQKHFVHLFHREPVTSSSVTRVFLHFIHKITDPSTIIRSGTATAREAPRASRGGPPCPR